MFKKIWRAIRKLPKVLRVLGALADKLDQDGDGEINVLQDKK